MFRLKADTTPAQKQALQKGLLALQDHFPQMISGELGIDWNYL